MSVILTITVRIPEEISEVYQTEYLRKEFGNRILSPMELPHPQTDGETIDAEVESVDLHWEG